MKIVVINNVTLDGVMQAPGRADEDTRGGFAHGGWASQNIDEPDPEIGAAMGMRMSQSDGLLLGRRTYEDLLTTWNSRGGMFKDALERGAEVRRVADPDRSVALAKLYASCRAMWSTRWLSSSHGRDGSSTSWEAGSSSRHSWPINSWMSSC